MSLRGVVLWLVFLLAAGVSPAQRRGPDVYAIWLSEEAAGPRLQPPARARAGLLRTPRPVVTQAVVDAVAATQEPIRRAAESLGTPVIGATQRLVNAVFIQATPEQAARLRSLPGVRGVVRMRRFQPLLDTAAALVNAPEAWTALGGVSNAGAGFRIAILDSGIDHTHPAFQDPDLSPPAGFPRARPEHLGFTNSKIIAARSYVGPFLPIDPRLTRPDDTSPRDRSGHGTLVAMIAAGRPVTDPNGRNLTGVAPKAYLGNYKVIGSADLQDFIREEAVLLAMADAVDDGMDILNLSLGSIALFGPDDTGAACNMGFGQPCDLLATAVAIAAEDFGVLTVAAAGNDGNIGSTAPALNTIASPATSYAAVSVGATTNSKALTSTLRAGPNAPPAVQSIPALFGNGPRPENDLTAAARTAESAGNDGLACSPFSGSLGGAVVLVRRGECDFEDKVLHAAAAGAAGVVVINGAGEDFPITMTGLVNATIPSVMIGNSAGRALRDFVSSTAGATVTLDRRLTPLAMTADEVADYSARGPNIDLNLKPDLVAPGEPVYAGTQNLDPNGHEYDPTRYTSLGGTSVAAPFASGAAALVWQQDPNLDPFFVISALVNTASADVRDRGQPARVTAAGAGQLNARAALAPGAVVDPATISFGELDNRVRLPISGTLLLGNLGTSAETFNLEVQQRDADANARVTVNGEISASIAVPARQTAQVVVALSGILPAPGFYEGVIRIRNASGSTNLRVPYQYMVARGQPHAILPLRGDGLTGTAGEPLPDLLVCKVVDEAGLPVRGLAVQFQVVEGGGEIVAADARTDIYGIAAADVDLGPAAGVQTFSAAAGGLTLHFVNFARQAPSISEGGVVNGASFAPGQRVAPGSIISIFGSNLSEGIRGAIRVPLPMALHHVSVSFDHPETGLSLPGRFFFVSPGQLNVQVPWELAGLPFAFVKARINDSASAVHRLELSDYAPGIFEYESGGQKLGVVTHADGAVVTPSNPAEPGETVVVYATGVGPVDQAPQTGEPASGESLVRTRQTPQVTVAGRHAEVFFSGLAPFFVGLNQINVTIPPGTPSGVQPLLVTSNGIASNTVNIPIR
jgi:minor extracellular serine protease Vpr